MAPLVIYFIWFLVCLFVNEALTFFWYQLYTIPPIRTFSAAVLNLWPAPSIERSFHPIRPLFMVLKWRWTEHSEAAKESTVACGNRTDLGDCEYPDNAQTCDDDGQQDNQHDNKVY